MSPSPLPVYLDTRKVFLQQAEMAGDIEFARLPRLRKLLAGDTGSVHAEIHCRIAENGLRVISGAVDATLWVSCQRCLEPVEINVQDTLQLAVVADEEAAMHLDPELDPWICEDYRIELAELIEEQLILCLPVVNYHADRDCLGKTSFGVAETAASAKGRESPFAVLKKLKEKGESH